MKNSQFSQQHLLSYSDIFDPAEKANFTKWLQDIPGTSSLETISYLLFRITNPMRYNFSPSDYLAMWMMRMQMPEQGMVFRYIQEKNPFNDPTFALLDIESCLDLLQQLLIHNNCQTDELTRADQVILFKCLLICNDRKRAKERKLASLTAKDDAETAIEKMLPVMIRRMELTKPYNFQLPFIKIDYFFRYCLIDPQYKKYLEIFLAHYRLDRHEAYMYHIVEPYMSAVIAPEPSNKMVIDEDYESATRLFDAFSINNETVKEDEDFRQLRAFPIYRSAGQTYVTLFTRFFLDKLFQGLLFDFARVIHGNGYPKMNFEQLKSELGNDFSEHYLFYQVMQRCFAGYGNCFLSGQHMKVLVKESEPDFYIRRGNKVFLFEFKDITLPVGVKYSKDFSVIKEGLMERTVQTKSGDAKAVLQLLQNAKHFFEEYYQAADQVDVSKCIIYPIFVHTEQALQASGINRLHVDRCNTLIKQLDLPSFRIKNIVLIHIDTLILFQDYFADEKLLLHKCLLSYFEYTSRDNVLNQLIGFDEYLKHHAVEKKLDIPIMIRQSEELRKSYGF